MSNEIKKFINVQLGCEVRVLDRGGEPWFVAKDVCDAIGFGNPRQAISNLEDDEKGVHSMDTLGGAQQVTIISEPGLYALISQSRKPEAKPFKRWVNHEVLPSIRKHGMYATPMTAEKMLNDPDVMIQLLTAIKADREKLAESRLLLEQNAPKVEFYDAVTGSSDTIDMGRVAKVLAIPGYGRNNLFELLREKKILMENNQPYQTYVDRGYFRLIEQKYQKPDGEVCISIKTVAYQSGLDYIRKVLGDTIPLNIARSA
jgi:anti-repressor protein